MASLLKATNEMGGQGTITDSHNVVHAGVHGNMHDMLEYMLICLRQDFTSGVECG